MSSLRNVFLSLVLALVLLPNVAQAAAQTAEDQAGCKRSDLSQVFRNQSANQTVARPATLKKQVDSISPYCEGFYCPWAHPEFACLCGCDAEECDCVENCPSGPGHFLCQQGCRTQLNDCYAVCLSI